MKRCIECAGRRVAFSSARAAVWYSGAARPLVRAWKERGLRPFAALAAELVADVVPRPVADVITYVPADGDRSLRRGHQPAAALAGEIAERWSLESVPLLGRTRAVGRQAGLPLRERRRNVRGAFVARPELDRRARLPRRIVLVDDVYTTGSTAAAAASALRAAGVRHVHVVTFARAVR